MGGSTLVFRFFLNDIFLLKISILSNQLLYLISKGARFLLDYLLTKLVIKKSSLLLSFYLRDDNAPYLLFLLLPILMKNIIVVIRAFT